MRRNVLPYLPQFAKKGEKKNSFKTQHSCAHYPLPNSNTTPGVLERIMPTKMRTIDMQIKTNIENTTKQQKQPHVNKLPCNLIMFMVYFE